ncbi:MAG: methyl-accepting chemotaxis protein, partial [Planctomycetota bacterium]|nr:methyl-accepting chemotaxis protein [Planctomycetota bacterium]
MQFLSRVFSSVGSRLLFCFAFNTLILGLVTVVIIMIAADRKGTDPYLWYKFIGGFLVAVIISYLLVRNLLIQWLVNPISKLTQASRMFAQEGHLQLDLDAAQYSGEIGELCQAFADMQKTLSEVKEVASAISRGDYSREIIAIGPLITEFKGMQNSLRTLAEQARCVAEGDLTSTVQAEGDLAHSFNMMVINLGTLVRQVRESGLRMSAASGRILAASEEQASYSAEQAASVSETSATIEELATSAKQIANNAQAVVDV